MATLPVYTTFVAGAVLTAGQLNTQVANAGNFFLARPYCNAYNLNTFSVASGTATVTLLDTELEDNDSMHSTISNVSRMICQTPGLFSIRAASEWASNAAGERRATLRLNAASAPAGGTFILSRDAAVVATIAGAMIFPEINLTYRMVNVGDYLELFVQQNSGGALVCGGNPYGTYLSMLWEIA